MTGFIISLFVILVAMTTVKVIYRLGKSNGYDDGYRQGWSDAGSLAIGKLKL